MVDFDGESEQVTDSIARITFIVCKGESDEKDDVGRCGSSVSRRL